MKQIGMIRCEKNQDRCPLTSCLRCLTGQKEGFSGYEACELAGVFTCRCPGDIAVDQAKILKSKGAEAIHFCTCTFAAKGDTGWVMNNGGFCDHIDELIERVQQAVGIPCVKGTAHLPKEYETEVWK